MYQDSRSSREPQKKPMCPVSQASRGFVVPRSSWMVPKRCYVGAAPKKRSPPWRTCWPFILIRTQCFVTPAGLTWALPRRRRHRFPRWWSPLPTPPCGVFSQSPQTGIWRGKRGRLLGIEEAIVEFVGGLVFERDEAFLLFLAGRHRSFFAGPLDELF